jgi:signal transduction histidine kinase
MLGYAEMVREAETDGDRAEFVQRIEIAGRDLLELIESTLEIGRIEAGRDTARFEATGLRALLGAIGEGCARLPRRPEVELRWPADVPDAAITTDPRKVTVILRNLVGNALKFTERGFVGLEVALDPDMVTLVVRDTGIGIRREDQRHIFEMFRQADGSDSRRFGGTGLGLYIVRRFVQQLDGAIALESEPGAGATFTIVLPRILTPGAVSGAA